MVKEIWDFFFKKPLLLFLNLQVCSLQLHYFFAFGSVKNQKIILNGSFSCFLIYIFSTGVGLRLFPILPAPTAIGPSTNQPQLIVVLGGGTLIDTHQNRVFLGSYSLLRLQQGFELWQKAKLPILVSGGNVWGGSKPTEAEIMAQILHNWGVPQKHIFIEKKSKNTRENAQNCAEIIQSQKWNSFYLVTSEVHLKRSTMNFHHFLPDASIIPISAHPPYDRTSLVISDFFPSLQAISAISQIIHEYLGYTGSFLLQALGLF